MTQASQVLAHLQAGKSITPVVAQTVYGIFRLSSVIEDLRQAGHEIDCVMKHDETGKQYGDYRIRRPIGMGSKVQVRRGYGCDLPTWVRRHKVATVVNKAADSSLVHFTRGALQAKVWLNDKELVNAD